MSKEQWRDVKGFEGLYKISSYGNIYSYTLEKLMKKQVNPTGYEQVLLYRDGKPFLKRIHRIVMENFSEEEFDHEMPVNHIDGNKLNNKVENLEMTTPKRNTRHAVKTGLIKSCKPVMQFTIKGEFIREYSSASEAARQLGAHHSQISRAASGKLYSSCGYRWKYKETKTKKRNRTKKVNSNIIQETFL